MRKLIILLLSSFLFSIPAFAEEILITCQNVESETICQFEGQSDYSVSAVELSFVLPATVESYTFTKDVSWEGDEDNKLLLLYTDINKVGKFSLGELKMKSDSFITKDDIKIEELSFFDHTFLEHRIVEKENVKQTEKKENIIPKVRKWFWGCGIIIIVGGFLIISIRKKRKE